jgi:hypothetical protein
MRFTNYKLLDLPHNIKIDWINKGYPTQWSSFVLFFQVASSQFSFLRQEILSLCHQIIYLLFYFPLW